MSIGVPHLAPSRILQYAGVERLGIIPLFSPYPQGLCDVLYYNLIILINNAGRM